MNGHKLVFRRRLVGYLFFAPAAVLLTTFMILPLLWNIILSFYKWNGSSNMLFVGLDNYIKVFQTHEIWITLQRSALIAAVSAVVSLVLGLGYALILYRLGQKEQTVFRFIFFSPAMMPMTVIGLLFVFVLSSEGLLNNILELIGLGGWKHAWLGDPNISLWVVGIIQGWRQSGVIMMLFVTAILALPPSLFESARLEGASYLQQIRIIILPLIKPSLRLNVSMLVMWGFKTYDLVYVMTKGGPGEYTYTTPLKIIQLGFNLNEYGAAASLGVLLTVVVSICVIVARYLLRGEDYEY